MSKAKKTAQADANAKVTGTRKDTDPRPDVTPAPDSSQNPALASAETEGLRSSEPPVLARLRELGARPEDVDGLAAVVEALALPVPAFLAAMPGEDAPKTELAPADSLLHTDLWPDAESAEDLRARLHAFLSSTGAADLLARWANYPVAFYSRPRLGLVAGWTEADAKRHPALCGTDDPATPAGHARYTCEFTGGRFYLPFGTPAPAVLLDTGGKRIEPGAFPDRSPLHSGEYVEGFDWRASYVRVHPALIEAGPAYVLWAVWTHVDQIAYRAAEQLADALDLLSAFAGLEADALAVEWPSPAYRNWEPVVREGEALTYRRTLAGFIPAK